MYSKHISSKYAQKVVSQFGVYSLTEEAVCLSSALLDTILLLTCEKVKDNPLGLLMVKRSIVNIFPPEFSKQILIHSTQAAEAVSTGMKLIADPVLSNPNRSNFKIPSPLAKNKTSIDTESIDPKQLEMELREKCVIFSAMGGKIIKTSKASYRKTLQRTAKQVEAIEKIAVFLNEAMEFIARILLRAATLEAQKGLTPIIDDTHLVAAGQDLNFAMLFSLVSMEDFFMLLPKEKRTSTVSPKNLGRDRSSLLSDIHDSHLDETSSQSALLPSSPTKNKIFSIAQKIRSAISGGNSQCNSRSPSPVPSEDDDPESVPYPKSPYPGMEVDNPRCDFEDYHGVELVSEPTPPKFIVLENSRWSLPQSERPPDFETLFASGKTVKLFVSRATRNVQ